MKKHTLEDVLNKIHKLHEKYPPDKQTPEIKKVLNEYYNIERDLMEIKNGINRQLNNDYAAAPQ